MTLMDWWSGRKAGVGSMRGASWSTSTALVAAAGTLAKLGSATALGAADAAEAPAITLTATDENGNTIELEGRVQGL